MLVDELTPISAASVRSLTRKHDSTQPIRLLSCLLSCFPPPSLIHLPDLFPSVLVSVGLPHPSTRSSLHLCFSSHPPLRLISLWKTPCFVYKELLDPTSRIYIARQSTLISEEKKEPESFIHNYFLPGLSPSFAPSHILFLLLFCKFYSTCLVVTHTRDTTILLTQDSRHMESTLPSPEPCNLGSKLLLTRVFSFSFCFALVNPSTLNPLNRRQRGITHRSSSSHMQQVMGTLPSNR